MPLKVARIAWLIDWSKCVCMYVGSGNIEVSSKSEQGVKSLGDVPWQRFLNNKALWGLVAVHCSFGVGPLVCLSWLPSYYSDVSLPFAPHPPHPPLFPPLPRALLIPLHPYLLAPPRSPAPTVFPLPIPLCPHLPWSASLLPACP